MNPNSAPADRKNRYFRHQIPVEQNSALPEIKLLFLAGFLISSLFKTDQASMLNGN
jgi:hypothetical protein